MKPSKMRGELGWPRFVWLTISVVGILLDANAVMNGAGKAWTTPEPNSSDLLYGVISYGAGWMAVWSHTITPLLSGKIVYGQELGPTGLPVPAQPVQPLFVEPMEGDADGMA